MEKNVNDDLTSLSASDTEFNLEEGPLDESATSNLDPSASTRFYNLQVEETMEQMNYESAVEVDHLVAAFSEKIIFSPGGNEGYIFMGAENPIQENNT